VHPLLYQTLYDLTPAGDKARLHSRVAIYIEDAYQGNPSHFAQLGHQYGLAKDYRPKAQEYCARAAVYYMSNGPLFYDEALQLLSQATVFADSALDYATLLGIVMERKNKLKLLRNQLIEDKLLAAIPQPSITSPKRRFYSFFFSMSKAITPVELPLDDDDEVRVRIRVRIRVRVRVGVRFRVKSNHSC
jgi:hypothetical protein